MFWSSGQGPLEVLRPFILLEGHDVLTLERDTESRIKPCGGGMAASVQQWFHFSLEPAVEQVIDQVDFSWCLEDPVVAELPGDAPFWIVRRETLDQLLSDQAIKAGAERLSGVEVNDIRRHETSGKSRQPTDAIGRGGQW